MAMRVPLRWIALLYGRVRPSLAATSGIHRATDVLKMLMAGADVAMLCSTLIRHGARQIGVVERDLIAWMEEHEYESVDSAQGQPEPEELRRSQRLRARPIHESDFAVPVGQGILNEPIQHRG